MQLPQLKIGNLHPRFPIIQGGMSIRVSTASLAAAVACCGGIGVIGGTGISAEDLREQIRAARKLSGNQGIVGVNIMYASGEFVQLVKTAINERIDVIFTGAGFSREIFHWCREAQIPVVPIVSSSRAAILSEKSGAAAVVAEGCEAGGHLGTDRSIKDILPEIKQAVKIPVIAAGGITDGYDMAEMIHLGADGVQLATRFLLSDECDVADEYKQAYLNARQEDIIIIKSPVGLPGRAIKNSFTQRIAEGTAPESEECEACLRHCSADYCIRDALLNARNGKVEDGVLFSGANVYKIKSILPVASIFENILREFALA